ncbi:hypothetical protein GCM10022393_32670 [Aquimarina addita]|uniref:DKNYY family protein n=1 Tax=Aquimarina addita TaxID=870485 RepID=A0ABP6URV8_9FLAO
MSNKNLIKVGQFLLICISLWGCKDVIVYKTDRNNSSLPNTSQINTQKKVTQENLTRRERILKTKRIVDSAHKKAEWQEVRDGLWKNKFDDIGFKTREVTEEGIFITRYITQLCCDGMYLKEVIDTNSFRYLGSSFYKDKKNIYTHYTTASGGNFSIVEDADHNTFRVLGDCYAKDKYNIYGERAMVMDHVDYKTFKTKKGVGCFAKDKNGYYFWGDTYTPSSDSDKESLLMINKLNE